MSIKNDNDQEIKDKSGEKGEGSFFTIIVSQVDNIPTHKPISRKESE